MKFNIFNKIINNDVLSYKIAEDNEHLAFLDIYPLKIGHTLVIPKKNYNSKIFSMKEKNYISIMIFSRKIAIGIENAIPCNRVGMFIMGFEIPHVHIHLIPMDKESDANFLSERINLSDDKFKFISNKIRNSIKL
ncbi:HIT family protein [Blattabacterium cuenoti]|uniref:HIT family protein n=1 Tax=Blattabacterium cuenoti TaxID=1653831 RepID=UPI00163CE64C|nr:HIT domain-containing protein [Blattabacterium cuenoti]